MTGFLHGCQNGFEGLEDDEPNQIFGNEGKNEVTVDSVPETSQTPV